MNPMNPKHLTVTLALAIAAGVALAALVEGGCTPAKEAAAGGTYATQLDDCVQSNTTQTAIDACRHRVDLAWGQADAGKDGG